MGSVYDPDAGILRLRHATLSVLSRLAVAPADPTLHDHDVAPLVAELRSLGILTERGMDPAVEPLARAIGEAEGSFAVEVDDHGELRRFRGWSSPHLGVVGAQVPGTDDYELMADRPAMLPALVEELVGLGTAVDPVVAGVATADGAALRTVLARGALAPAGEVTAEVGAALDSVDAAWAEAFSAAVRGAALRWQLRVAEDWMEVLDAGRSGLWLLEPVGQHPDRTSVRPATVPQVRKRVAALLAAPSRRPAPDPRAS